MTTGVGLCVLGLLCLHSVVLGQEVQPGVLLFCDDPSVEKAVGGAVQKFNERLSTGHNLALFQIQGAVKSENDSGSVYTLQFTTRRSDCAAGSSKPWTDCDYLPSGHKMPFKCNATVYVTETESDTQQVDCLLDDYIVPERAACLGCPEYIDETSEDIRVPLSVAISKFNSMSDSTHLFNIHTVGHATRQVVAGFRYKLKFDMQKTTCAKAEHKDLNVLCGPDEQNEEFTHCNSTVDVAPWRPEAPEAQLECEAGALPISPIIRRRPTGWTPLRNHFLMAPPSFVSPAPSQASSTTEASAKKESSEEDVTVPKPPALPDAAADATSDSPFHCPSKPWKPFQPSLPEAPSAAPEVEASLQPSADMGFSDADLQA